MADDTGDGHIGGNDIDWHRYSGGTPSSGTGPSSASEGSYYAYVEATNPNYPNDTACLISPLYNIQDWSSVNISFDYHMYGATMGSLRLEISANGGTSWNAMSLWYKSGDQGNSWYSASVDIDDTYLEGTSPIRFRFKGITGTSYTSDIALDNITITAIKDPFAISAGNYVHTTTYKTESGSSGAKQEEIQP